MAVLSNPDRLIVSRDFQAGVSGRAEAFGALTKTDILAAVAALDDYLNTNAGSINTAIPQPARGALTAPQKAELLTYVIKQRYAKGA